MGEEIKSLNYVCISLEFLEPLLIYFDKCEFQGYLSNSQKSDSFGRSTF